MSDVVRKLQEDISNIIENFKLNGEMIRNEQVRWMDDWCEKNKHDCKTLSDKKADLVAKESAKQYARECTQKITDNYKNTNVEMTNCIKNATDSIRKEFEKNISTYAEKKNRQLKTCTDEYNDSVRQATLKRDRIVNSINIEYSNNISPFETKFDESNKKINMIVLLNNKDLRVLYKKLKDWYQKLLGNNTYIK